VGSIRTPLTKRVRRRRDAGVLGGSDARPGVGPLNIPADPAVRSLRFPQLPPQALAR
jgi:hypothetical protein